jgi:hypothetical protein
MRDFPDGVPHGAIYCGRRMQRCRLKGSAFANSFKLASNAAYAECIAMWTEAIIGCFIRQPP